MMDGSKLLPILVRRLARLLCVAAATFLCHAATAQTSPLVNTGWNSPTSTSMIAAGRILNQATFGNTALGEYNVEQSGITAFVDQQLAVPPFVIPAADPKPEEAGDCNNFQCATQYFWWNDILFGPDQLRERVAYELSKLFVISINSVDPRYLPNYLNLLNQDAFGNWFTLMQDVTLSPAMGTYLNMADSVAPAAGSHANENFAREFMQLFSLGINKLNQDGSLALDANGAPIPNYTAAQIQNFALAFTGWTFANYDCSNLGYIVTYWYADPLGQTCPMVPLPAYHSTVAKALLRGVTLPAGQTPQQDLIGALQNIFLDPSLPPFVCLRLIQDLVKSNPSPAYVSRIAGVFTNDGTGVRGNMKAVIRAILLDPEARAGDSGVVDPAAGRLRDPVQFWAAMMRGLLATSNAVLPNVAFMNQAFDLWLADFGEAPHAPGSVFSFYSPQFALQSKQLAPEFENENGYTLHWLTLHVQDALDNNFNLSGPEAKEFSLDLSMNSVLTQYAAQAGPTALVNLLDALLLHNTMTQDMQQAIVQAVSGDDPSTMTKNVAYLIVTSPQFRVIQ